MTASTLAVSRLEDGSKGTQGRSRVVACAFCRRRLADEYYFTCRKCDASFCYIHMSRHQSGTCARQTRRRQGAAAVTLVREVATEQGRPGLLLAENSPGRGPSANV